MAPPPDTQRLAESLDRVGLSLSRLGGSPGRAPARAASPRGARAKSAGLLAASTALLAVGVATAQPALVAAALAVLIAGGLVLFTAVGQSLLGHLPGVERDPTRVHVGLGADVAGDAVIEPGASVEMGVTVRSKAVLRKGAVVRMGATVGAGAVLEAGAVVSWGVDVGAGAVIEAGAVVGAGSSVAPGARVPKNARVLPGSMFSQGVSGAAVPAAPVDPRHARLDLVCDRLEADWARTSEELRGHLGAPAQTVAALRATCHELIRREGLLRAESSADGRARLEAERAVLWERAARATDASVKRSLEGALAAIAERQRQQGLLETTAERLDAEATRLLLTLEAMSTQVVRLLAAGDASADASRPLLVQSVRELQEEIDAVAGALEELAADGQGMAPVAPLSEAPGAGGIAPVRERD